MFHFTVDVTSYAADSDPILPLSKVVSQKENFIFQAIERRKIEEIREFKTKYLQVPCDSSLDPDSTKGLISEAKKKKDLLLR